MFNIINIRHHSTGARGNSRSVRFSLVVNIVPRDDVFSAAGRRSAHCEDESGIKRSSQQLANLLTFSVTWQVSRTPCAFEPLTWVRMILLRMRQHNVVQCNVERKTKRCG